MTWGYGRWKCASTGMAGQAQGAHRRREVGKARAQVGVAGRARVDAALPVHGVDEDGALCVWCLGRGGGGQWENKNQSGRDGDRGSPSTYYLPALC